MAVADCTFGRRGQWRGRGGTESGQERAHGAPLAATLCGQRGGWAVEGRHPPARAQATDGEENQASREPDAQREAAGCYPLERTHDGGAGWHRTVVGAQDLGRARAQAASDENLQALARSELRRQRSRISSASTSIRPTRPWCWRSMKRAKSR